MKVEEACRLSPDGIAETRTKIRTSDNNICSVNLYARFNEVQGRYTVTQYIQRQKIETFREFRDPHATDRWHPSRRVLTESLQKRQAKLAPCLYMLIAKNKYRFTMGITDNIYMRIYQMRLIFGELDLETSCIVQGREEHLHKLERHLQFVFEEYHTAKPLPSDDEVKNWFDLDCFWYAKNEVRRVNNFREEKIYRIKERIDLNTFILEDIHLLNS